MTSVSQDQTPPPLPDDIRKQHTNRQMRFMIGTYIKTYGWQLVLLQKLKVKSEGATWQVINADTWDTFRETHFPLQLVKAIPYNIALHTGLSKLMVVDFDINDSKYGKPFAPDVQAVLDKHNIPVTNAPALMDYLATHHPTRIHNTKSFGYHLFYYLDLDQTPMPKLASGDLVGGVDVQYGSKLAVLPPSIAYTDKITPPAYGSYRIDPLHDVFPIPHPPDWLIEAIHACKQIKHTTQTTQTTKKGQPKYHDDDPMAWVQQAIAEVKNGIGRNDIGASLCGKLAQHGYDHDTITAYMGVYHTAVEYRGGQTYDWTEVENTINSIAGYKRNALQIGAINDPITDDHALATNAPETPHNAPEIVSRVNVPPLPAYAFLQRAEGEGCKWLDDYIAYSTKWSDRAWSSFHTAVGLWVLSTISARRVGFRLADKTQYTSLFVLLSAPSSVWAKTTTARIGINLLNQSGLGFLLLPDEMTPQSMIDTQAGYQKTTYASAHQATKDRIANMVAFAGQRSWFYEEFGNALAKIMQENSNHHMYHGLLRQFDDHYPTYTNATLTRGENTIHNPYMALLGNLTPADLTRHATKNHAFWTDGFWARFLFASPPPEQQYTYKTPIIEQATPPRHLITTLQAWHTRLGVPDVQTQYDRAEQSEGKGEGKGKQKRDTVTYYKDPTNHPETILPFAPDTLEAYINYDRALATMLQGLGEDMAGNYTRFAAKALRIACMFASIDNAPMIRLHHWAHAQQITEQFRVDLHNLYATVTEKRETTTKRAQEDRVLEYIRQHNTLGATARDIYRALRIDTETTMQQIEALKRAGVIVARRSPNEKADRHFMATD